MSSWTKGEWAVNGPYVCVGKTIIGEAEQCDAPDKTLQGRCEERIANARMFAASKDLYEALAMVLARGRIDDSESAMDQVGAALAKARGE